jgi:type I restriction enzyme S subunit
MMKRWPEKPLGEVCTVNPKLAASDAPLPETVVTFVPMAAVDENSGTIQDPERRRYSQVVKGYTPFIDNDVLFAKITPCMQNGKAAIARDLSNGLGFGSTEFHILRPRKDILSAWIFAFIRQPQFRRAAEVSFTGSAGQQRVPTDFLKQFPIPVPPLAEQKRIVKLLDEADELRKLRVQADRRTANLIPALFHEMFGDPVENPKAYSVKRLSEVCNRITDGTHQPPAFSENGIPFLFVRNIVNGAIDFDTEKFITETTFADLTRSIRPERGDILYSTVGSYGVAVEVNTDRKFAFQRHIGHLKPNRDLIDAGFLTAQLNTPFVRSQANQAARGIAQKTVNLAEIRNFKVVVPPLLLQRQFAARVAEIRAMEAEQAASRRRLDDLFQSMLHRAFNGDLSTQIDSGDASVVVKAEHKEQNAVPGKHSKSIMYYRAAFDSYVISKLERDKNLGRTKMEKISHLAEYHCGIDLEREPIRDAAGPNDYPSRMKVENLARKQKWYFSKKDKVKVDYLPGPYISKSRHTAENFLGERKPAVDALISLMRPLDTAASEIVATLYAVWNDFLLAGKTPTDDELITEVRHNWHPDKLRIPVDEWEKGLSWMREHQLTPRGVGRPTIRNKSV